MTLIEPAKRTVATRRRRVHQPEALITSEQIRAARGLLKWSVARLAREAKVAVGTISNAERGAGVPVRMQVDTLLKIRGALERGGCEFIGERGVQLR